MMKTNTDACSVERHSAHYPGLDTLRAVAILMVIPRHAREILTGDFFGDVLKKIFNQGWVGVDLFFVLSGFLIATQLFQSLKRDGQIHFKRFFLKRSLRIMPSYYFVLLLYLVWPDFREHPDLDPAWRFVLYVMNYGRKGEAFSHAWSLCVEEHFYLIFPFIVAACVWKKRILRPAALVIGTLVGVMLLRCYLWLTGAPFYPAVYRPSHTHLDGLTVGVGLAALREYRPITWGNVVSQPWKFFTGGIILVGLSMWGFGDPIGYVLNFTFVSLGFGAILISAMSPGFWLATTRIPGTPIIAVLAFTLYLTHKQMIHLAKVSIVHYLDHRALTLMVAILLMFLCSYVIHFVIERPGLNLRDKILKNKL